MTEQEFQTQMVRLSNCYGKAAYNNERSALIWKEVRDFPAHVFRTMVDNFIGNLRQAPLLPEVREAISRYRESSWAIEKNMHKQESQAAFTTLEEVVKKAIADGKEHDPEFQKLVKYYGFEKLEKLLKPIATTDDDEEIPF